VDDYGRVALDDLLNVRRHFLYFESLAVFEQKSGENFSTPEFGDWFERMTKLVESGRREFYNIE
jgi:hypothetical protein